MAAKATSLSPETFVEGGGLVDDVDLTIQEAKFIMWDYNGKIPQATPALCLSMLAEEDEKIEQYYSMGSSKDWMPSDNGKQLLSVGQATAIRKTSNGGIFLTSLVDAGFPVEKLGDDITVLEGLQAHMIRVPAPKRGGLKQDERKYEQTILVVSEIITMPGDKKKPTGAPKGAKTSKTTVASSTGGNAAKIKSESGGGDDVAEKATTQILSLLEASGSIAKKDIPGKLFQTMKNDPDRNTVIKMVFDDEFLSSGPWVYEDGILISS